MNTPITMTKRRDPRDLLASIVRPPPANPTRAEQFEFVESLCTRDLCTPPSLREPEPARRRDTRSRTTRDLVRVGLEQMRVVARITARLPKSGERDTRSPAEIERDLGRLRYASDVLDELLAISRGNVAALTPTLNTESIK